MDPWSKGKYSRYIREVSMAMDGLPEGVASPGRVPEQLLQAAPILKRRRRRYRGDFPKKRSVFRVSVTGGKYRRRGHREGPQGSQEAPWRGLGWGRARDPFGVPVVAPLPPLVFPEASVSLIFYLIFPDFLEHFQWPKNLKYKNSRKQQLAAGCTELID